MDFLYTSRPDETKRLLKAMHQVGHRQEDIALAMTGKWGTLIATTTPYQALSPLVTPKRILAVIGDPLLEVCSHPSPDTKPQSRDARTQTIADAWENGPLDAVLPHHPAAMLRIDRETGNVELITDALGGVPVFHQHHIDGHLLATTPDLIASIGESRFDPLSGVELITTGRIHFPHSLYQDIHQLLPGAIHRFPEQKTQRWWTPPRPIEGKDPREWAQLVRDALYDTLHTLSHQVHGPGWVTLSAGKDSRAIARAASSSMKVAAVTLSPVRNMESRIAKKVARKTGIPHHHRVAGPDHKANIIRSRPLMLGSSNNWKHAHYHLGVLGVPRDSAFVLGGHTADTRFYRSDAMTQRRERGVRNGQLGPDHPYWDPNGFSLSMEPATRAAIEDRWEQGAAFLGLGGLDRQTRFMHPLSSQFSAAQFHSARRNFPAYELFMTEPMVRLGFQIPTPMKARPKKDDERPLVGKYLFEEERAHYADIPINPGKSVKRFHKKIKRRLPASLVPMKVRFPGSWAHDTNGLEALFQQAQESAYQALKPAFTHQMTPERLARFYEHSVACVQVQTVVRRCARPQETPIVLQPTQR
jgi:asparagine synthetase B (glutamine-hydrolysing)